MIFVSFSVIWVTSNAMGKKWGDTGCFSPCLAVTEVQSATLILLLW